MDPRLRWDDDFLGLASVLFTVRCARSVRPNVLSDGALFGSSQSFLRALRALRVTNEDLNMDRLSL
jgi:hypothetical protein